MGENFEQPCWWCAKAYGTGECPWADKFQPVDGWRAEKTIIRNKNNNCADSEVSSFKIKKCPNFEDERALFIKSRPNLSDYALASQLGVSKEKVRELRRQYDKT